MKIKRRNSFSATNASSNEAKLAYIRLNSQTPSAFACSYGPTGGRLQPSLGASARRVLALLAPPELRATAGHGSTKGVVGGSFTLNTRIAFGDGCDRHSYVSIECNCLRTVRKLTIGLD